MSDSRNMFSAVDFAVQDTGGAFFGIMVFLLIIGFYFLPTLIAIISNHRRALIIFLVNLFFGWSFIGWFIALIWSFTD